MHRIIQADLTATDPLALLGIEVVDAVYSDPPWGPGNLMYWRTQNKEQVRPSWPLFLERFATLCARACPAGPVWVEMGLRWEDELVVAMRAAGFEHRLSMTCRYRAGSKWLPNVLCLFGQVVTPDPSDLPPEDRFGPKLVTWALAQHFGTTVLDPCTGLGNTAKACLALGRTFYGSELNPRRLARTQALLDRAAKKAETTARRAAR